MTPEEFAAQTGLSLEEAEMVLRARRSKSQEAGAQARVLSKLERAFEALRRAERETGVATYPNPDNGHGAGDGFGGSDYPDCPLESK